MKKVLFSTLLATMAGAIFATAAQARPHKVCHWDPHHHHHRVCHWVR
ncbi:MAG TPA: HHHH-motif protein [Dyella sp.]|nr:HHHH-motif protein [Dyella sp.]HUB88484.1 HHHH-motif protein [Dyella sp.]